MSTELQRISREVNWFIGFVLQRCTRMQINRLDASNRTLQLISKRNIITQQLEESVKDDYEVHKKYILAARRRQAKLDQKRN